MANLPDGLIFEFDVDYKGIQINVVKRDLVYCKHCKYAKEYIDNDTCKCSSLRCEYGNTNINVADRHFCSVGEIIEN